MGFFDWFRDGKKPASKSGADVMGKLRSYEVPSDLAAMTSTDVSDPNELLGRVLERPDRDSLRRPSLGLWDPEENHYDDAVAVLATLDLSLGTLRDEGAKALVEGRDSFTSIEMLNVGENFIEDELDALVAAFPKVIAGAQERPDQDGDETYVYVSVGE